MKIVSTLIELQRLKRLERTGWTLRGMGNGTESVAAYSFGVGVTAMLLGDEIQARGTAIDLAKVLRMALLHDWAETRLGDLPKLLYLISAAKREGKQSWLRSVM